MQSLDYMPLLQKYVIQEGTLFDKHYCTVSICCPSRVNIWTGLAAHNNNVTDLNRTTSYSVSHLLGKLLTLLPSCDSAVRRLP
jgi:arylsulfatase A-like enzyme